MHVDSKTEISFSFTVNLGVVKFSVKVKTKKGKQDPKPCKNRKLR